MSHINTWVLAVCQKSLLVLRRVVLIRAEGILAPIDNHIIAERFVPSSINKGVKAENGSQNGCSEGWEFHEDHLENLYKRRTN